MTIILNTQFSSDVTYVGGELMIVFLIVSLVIASLLVDTRYQNRLTTGIFDMCSSSLMILFVIMVIFKIVLIT